MDRGLDLLDQLPPPEEDTFKVLISSDNHLGVYDNNPWRENDSFNTFEEILTIGKKEEVDFALLCGDLFHENKPRPATFQRTVDILQKYCLGPRPVSFEYLGNPSLDFHGQQSPCVNYYNPNMNIELPIFTIHGNHDDPTGLKKTSVIDHLAAANLVNHFGTVNDLNDIEVRPVLLRKGCTYLALYGLGAMKDMRLYRLMKDNKVKFLRPTEERDKWFNIFVIHQNRVRHGVTNFIPESFIPGFIDLVVWGHEHECKPEIDDLNNHGDEEHKVTKVIQPGSSVATQLQPGEAAKKHTLIFTLYKRNFRMEKIPLKTIRPFIIDEVHVSDILKKKPKDVEKAVEVYLDTRIKQLMDDANEMLTGDENQPLEPLIRVKLLHEDNIDSFNSIRFSQNYAKQISNVDVVVLSKVLAKKSELGDDMDISDIHAMIMEADEDIDLGSHVEQIVEKHFLEERKKGGAGNFLHILSERGISEAVRSAAEKDDQGSIRIIIESQIAKTMAHLEKKKVTEETIEEEILAFRDIRFANSDREVEEVDNVEETNPIQLPPEPFNFNVVKQQGYGITIYKVVNYQPGSNEIRVEEISAEEAAESETGSHHLTARDADGNIIHLETFGPQIDQSSPHEIDQLQYQHHHHLTEEAAALLSLHGNMGMTPIAVAENQEERVFVKQDEIKILQNVDIDGEYVSEIEVIQSADGRMILQRRNTAEENQRFIQLFTTADRVEVDGEEEPQQLEISLEQLDPLMRQSLLDSGYLTSHQPPTTEANIEVHDQTKKEKEISTLAALDIGCEWSLVLPFGFQGQTLNEQCQKLILNVWHYFKRLKKCPEYLQDKNAQGLAGDALNIGTKTIGRIGKVYSNAKLYALKRHSKINQKRQNTTVKSSFSATSLYNVRKTLQNRPVGKKGKQKTNETIGSEDDEAMIVTLSDDDDSPEAGPSVVRGRGRGRGRAGATGSPATGRGRGRGSRGGGGGTTGRKLVQTQLPVKVKNRGHSKSVIDTFDSDSD